MDLRNVHSLILSFGIGGTAVPKATFSEHSFIHNIFYWLGGPTSSECFHSEPCAVRYFNCALLLTL